VHQYSMRTIDYTFAQHEYLMCTHYALKLRVHPQFYFHTAQIFNVHTLHTNIAPTSINLHCALPILNVHTLHTKIMCAPQALHCVMLNFSVLTHAPPYVHATHSAPHIAKFQCAHPGTIILCASPALHLCNAKF
jgi:hypothetical protein